MEIKEVVKALERFAPLPLQESYDNAGLQIGITGSKCSGALLCLDITESVIDTAIARGCNLIVAHHPLLFRGLKRIGDEGYVERCVRRAILAGITIYAAHTNLDNAPGGVCHEMAARLGLQDTTFLAPGNTCNNCDGQPVTGGSGLIGTLPSPMQPTAFLQLVKDTFGIEALAHNVGPDRSIQRVALCGGAGEFLIDTAVRRGADIFLTGEIGYHHYFGYERSIWLAALGHYESERYTIDLMHRIIQQECPTIPLFDFTDSTSPIHYL